MIWALTDTATMARRELAHWHQQPGAMLVGWLFPVLLVLMFGGLFGGALTVPEGGDYIDFLMPGIYALTMFFGIEATMIAVTTDAASGVTDRFRSLPMSASAVVLGRCVADLLNSAVGLGVILLAGLALGWRAHEGLPAAAAAIGLLLLLRMALLWVGILIGLLAKGPNSVMAVQILVWPVGFLSSVFVDPATMPSWLGAIAEWSPLSITAAATRDLFGNPGSDAAGWPAEHAIPLAVAMPLLLTAVFLPLAVRRYRRLGG
jgi:ABC-2 type transport system permease protein